MSKVLSAQGRVWPDCPKDAPIVCEKNGKQVDCCIETDYTTLSLSGLGSEFAVRRPGATARPRAGSK